MRCGCAKDDAHNQSRGTTIKWSNVVAAEFDDGVTPSATYYKVLGIDEDKVNMLQTHNDSVSEFINMIAGIGGGFLDTNELRIMKYNEAINGPDGIKWSMVQMV